MGSFNSSVFLEAIEKLNTLHHNKYATRTAIGIMKTLRKIRDIKEEEEKKT